MTKAQLRELAAQLQYRPGWNFYIDERVDLPGYFQIRIYGRVADAYNPGDTGLQCAQLVDWDDLRRWDERALVEFVYAMLRQMELHECAEFFRVKGARPFDPHRGEVTL